VVKVLLDEDIKAKSLVRQLREAGFDVLTTTDLGLDGRTDSEVLLHATEGQRIVMTYNCDDFRVLHKIAPSHSGIVLVYQEKNKRMSHSQMVRALQNIINTGDSLVGILHTLNHWIF